MLLFATYLQRFFCWIIFFGGGGRVEDVVSGCCFACKWKIFQTKRKSTNYKRDNRLPRGALKPLCIYRAPEVPMGEIAESGYDFSHI